MSDEDVAQTIRGLVQQPGTAAVDVVAAAVRHLADAHPRWGWVGVYLLRADALHLGPYVGPPTETVVGQIDVDSDDVGAFGAADERLLEEVAGLIAPAVADLAAGSRSRGWRATAPGSLPAGLTPGATQEGAPYAACRRARLRGARA
jgi:hypothetical protein